jgi:hypothetical protein
LTAGEFTDSRRQLVPAETEPLQQLGRCHLATVDLITAAQPAQHLGDPVARNRCQLITLLVEYRQPDGLATLDMPGVCARGAGD